MPPGKRHRIRRSHEPAQSRIRLFIESLMGKVPCIETSDGFSSESSAIMEYLKYVHTQNPLMPSSAFAKAKVREINKVLELYIELAAKRHLGSVFFGAPRNEAAVEEVRPLIEQGLGALKSLGSFNLYFCRRPHHLPASNRN